MDKHILEQYTSMQEEQKDLRRRIEKLRRRTNGIRENGFVADTVTLGKHGKKPLGTKKIEGFPVPEYQHQSGLLRTYERKLADQDQRLLELLQEVEEYVSAIPDSRIRRIFRYRYVDGLTWKQVAHRMGRYHTADSCRMAHDRYLRENG